MFIPFTLGAPPNASLPLCLAAALRRPQRKARNSATMKMAALTSYAVAQTSVLARLTWWELSWDIM